MRKEGRRQDGAEEAAGLGAALTKARTNSRSSWIWDSASDTSCNVEKDMGSLYFWLYSSLEDGYVLPGRKAGSSLQLRVIFGRSLQLQGDVP